MSTSTHVGGVMEELISLPGEVKEAMHTLCTIAGNFLLEMGVLQDAHYDEKSGVHVFTDKEGNSLCTEHLAFLVYLTSLLRRVRPEQCSTRQKEIRMSCYMHLRDVSILTIRHKYSHLGPYMVRSKPKNEGVR